MTGPARVLLLAGLWLGAGLVLGRRAGGGLGDRLLRALFWPFFLGADLPEGRRSWTLDDLRAVAGEAGEEVAAAVEAARARLDARERQLDRLPAGGAAAPALAAARRRLEAERARLETAVEEATARIWIARLEADEAAVSAAIADALARLGARARAEEEVAGTTTPPPATVPAGGAGGAVGGTGAPPGAGPG